jgi:hypothetical protein
MKPGMSFGNDTLCELSSHHNFNWPLLAHNFNLLQGVINVLNLAIVIDKENISFG